MRVLVALLLLVGCSDRRFSSSKSCQVIEVDNGVQIICPDGSSAVVFNGTNGSNGSNGIDGSNGTNGLNGTQITTIKFCSHLPIYPSTFPEYGVCIDNMLYAVYSANGGFLTYLPNGSYSSNGKNSACAFTVNGCIISY